MIDWHCHLLPGVDDGSKNLAESLAMGRILADAGFTEVCCTPHCLHGVYDNTPEIVQQTTAALQKAFQKEDIPLRLHPGMEYYLDEMFLKKLDDLQPLGNSRLVLVEAPQQASPEILKNTLFQLLRRNWVPVMAHPERCTIFDNPHVEKRAAWLRKMWPFNRGQGSTVEESLLQTLVNMGCKFQGNISSFVGGYGPEVARQAHAHRVAGIYGCFGSDGHDAKSLKRMLVTGLKRLAEVQGDTITKARRGGRVQEAGSKSI